MAAFLFTSLGWPDMRNDLSPFLVFHTFDECWHKKILNATIYFFLHIDRCKPWMRCQLWVLFQLDTQASILPPASRVRTAHRGCKRWDESGGDALMMLRMFVWILCMRLCGGCFFVVVVVVAFSVPFSFSLSAPSFLFPLSWQEVAWGYSILSDLIIFTVEEERDKWEMGRQRHRQMKWKRAGRGEENGTFCRSSAPLNSFPWNQSLLKIT